MSWLINTFRDTAGPVGGCDCGMGRAEVTVALCHGIAKLKLTDSSNQIVFKAQT